MWVTKLLISPVKKRIFCPKTTKIGSFGQFGPGHAGLFGALLVGRLVVMARGLYLARHLFTLLIKYNKGDCRNDCILSSFVFHQIFRYNVCEYLELRLAGNVVPNLHQTFPPPALNLNLAYLYKSLIILVLSYLIKSPFSEANLLNDQKR